MGVTPFTRREWIRSSVCLVNCWFGWDLLCMSLLTSVINVLSLSFSSLPSPLWPFCFDLGLLLADATWHLRKRRSAFEKMLPPNAPETQEIITTQASWTKQTVLLHFSTFWQQFKIPHTFLFWRLPLLGLPVILKWLTSPWASALHTLYTCMRCLEHSRKKVQH